MAASRKSADEVRGMIRARMPGIEGELLVQIFDGLNADVQALADALTAMAAKLNADATVTDTDYAGADIDLD